MNEQQLAWRIAWNEHIGKGKRNRERIAELLAEDPNLSAAELGRRVGCTRECARKHKRYAQQCNITIPKQEA